MWTKISRLFPALCLLPLALCLAGPLFAGGFVFDSPSRTQVSRYALAVTLGGSGSVTSSPAGINCGSTCTYNFPKGISITLSETPFSGYYFSGWVGAGCSGTGLCVVTMNSAQSVTASFVAEPVLYTLSVSSIRQYRGRM
jgi:hypothetical protein